MLHNHARARKQSMHACKPEPGNWEEIHRLGSLSVVVSTQLHGFMQHPRPWRIRTAIECLKAGSTNERRCTAAAECSRERHRSQGREGLELLGKETRHLVPGPRDPTHRCIIDACSLARLSRSKISKTLGREHEQSISSKVAEAHMQLVQLCRVVHEPSNIHATALMKAVWAAYCSGLDSLKLRRL